MKWLTKWLKWFDKNAWLDDVNEELKAKNTKKTEARDLLEVALGLAHEITNHACKNEMQAECVYYCWFEEKHWPAVNMAVNFLKENKFKHTLEVTYEERMQERSEHMIPLPGDKETTRVKVRHYTITILRNVKPIRIEDAQRESAAARSTMEPVLIERQQAVLGRVFSAIWDAVNLGHYTTTLSLPLIAVDRNGNNIPIILEGVINELSTKHGFVNAIGKVEGNYVIFYINWEPK
ncbi:hypothetical protein [Burkholderia phage BCSR5]|nr:hypothetical protein [Burkholderia phage BCSR5]